MKNLKRDFNKKENPKNSYIQIRIKQDLKDKLQKECYKRGFTMTDLITEYIEEKLENFNPHKQQKIQF